MEVQMNITKGIIKHATIQGIAEYLLYGDSIQSSYLESNDDLKLEKAFTEYEEQLKMLEVDCIPSILDMSNNLASEIAEVYITIGLKAGMQILIDLLRKTEL